MNVPLIDYVDLLNGSAHYAGLDPDDLDRGEFTRLRNLHGDRLKRIWEHRPWSFLKPVEKRYFRDLYVNGTYSATAEVYYAGPAKYYQALTSVISGQAPATLSGTTWTTNTAYWAESATEYIASEYAAATAYVRGDKVFYSTTGRYYQLFATTSTGNAPTDTTKWGVLTAFNRYVAYAQTGQTAFTHAFAAWDRDPRNDGRARQLIAFLSAVGLQVMSEVNECWVELRDRLPLLTGDEFVTTATYAAGDQIYFLVESSATYRGNLYTCLTATSAGESPVTAAAKWTRVQIPAQFSTYLIHGAAADYLMADGEVTLRDREEKTAKEDLETQAALHDGQAANYNRTQVGTR